MALSSDLHPLLAQMLSMAPSPPFSSLSVAQARDNMKARMAPLLAAFAPQCTISDLEIPTGPSDGAGMISLRLLVPPNGDALLPVVVFLHGGGWVVGDNQTHTPMADAIAMASGAAVLMVDYGLAPERPFPAAVEDGLTAIDWVVANGADHGLDALRIAVAGDSAGGNLAAVLARRCRDRDGPSIRAQYLIYPVIDLPDPSAYVSYTSFGEYGLSAEDMAWFWSLYAGGAAPGPDLLPLMADLAGLPPALIHTAQFDVLRDEGRAYAAALARAGVATSTKCWPGMIHGFLSLTGPLDVAGQAAMDAGAWLREQLA